MLKVGQFYGFYVISGAVLQVPVKNGAVLQVIC